MAPCPGRRAAAAAVVLACALLLPCLPSAAAVGGCQDGDLQAKDEANCIKFCNENAPAGTMAVPSIYTGGKTRRGGEGLRSWQPAFSFDDAHLLQNCWPSGPAQVMLECWSGDGVGVA